MLLFLNAITPLLLLVICILGLRLSVAKSAIISTLATIITVIFVWQMPIPWITAASLKAILIALEIGLILVGALTFFKAVQTSPIPKLIKTAITGLIPDRTLQAITLGFLFVALIEGAAGFGTPALIAAPMLLALGFKPTTAIVTTLIGNAGAVTFGAIGTPLVIGLTQGLGDSIMQANLQLLSNTAISIALINSLPLLAVPFLIAFAIRRLEPNITSTPWVLVFLSGLSFVIPYIITAHASYELPTVIGATIGLILTLLLCQLFLKHPQSNSHHHLPILKALSPYLLIVTLLIISRLPSLPINSFLKSISLSLPNLAGTTLGHSFSPLLSPSTVLILAAIFTTIIFSTKSLKSSLTFALSRALKPTLILGTIAIMVQLMIYSGNNPLSLPNLPQYIGSYIGQLPLPWIIPAPLIGLFGSFITGSATVSNLLFSSLQYQAALDTNSSITTILALQTIGAAAGNMIALHNLIAVSTVVGKPGQEGTLIKLLFPKALIYAILTILSALLLLLIRLV